jgi:hypothetical protein
MQFMGVIYKQFICWKLSGQGVSGRTVRALQLRQEHAMSHQWAPRRVWTPHWTEARLGAVPYLDDLIRDGTVVLWNDDDSCGTWSQRQQQQIDTSWQRAAEETGGVDAPRHIRIFIACHM